jgi:hypothetical protein
MAHEINEFKMNEFEKWHGYSRDANGKLIIPKGTSVRVKTVNGGDLRGILEANHYPTYDAQLVGGIIIPAYRIETVTIINEEG